MVKIKSRQSRQHKYFYDSLYIFTVQIYRCRFSASFSIESRIIKVKCTIRYNLNEREKPLLASSNHVESRRHDCFTFECIHVHHVHSDMRNLMRKLLLRLHRILRIDESSLTFIPPSSNKIFSQRVYLNIVEGPFQGSRSKKKKKKKN